MFLSGSIRLAVGTLDDGDNPCVGISIVFLSAGAVFSYLYRVYLFMPVIAVFTLAVMTRFVEVGEYGILMLARLYFHIVSPSAGRLTLSIGEGALDVVLVVTGCHLAVVGKFDAINIPHLFLFLLFLTASYRRAAF